MHPSSADRSKGGQSNGMIVKKGAVSLRWPRCRPSPRLIVVSPPLDPALFSTVIGRQVAGPAAWLPFPPRFPS